MQNRIVKTELIEWRNILPLQPQNAKHIFNYKDIEASILRYGFAQPFYVWENKGKIYTVDGHTRIEVLSNMENVPELLPATFINAKSRKEAIEILIEVYNQKHNPFDIEVLEELIQVEELDVNVASVNVYNVEQIEEDAEHKENVEDISNMIAVSLTEKEAEIWLHTKEKIGIKKDKNVIFELIKLYTNENGIS